MRFPQSIFENRKTLSLLTFHQNFLNLEKAATVDILSYVTDLDFFVHVIN